MYRLIGLKSIGLNNFKVLTSIRNQNILCDLQCNRKVFCDINITRATNSKLGCLLIINTNDTSKCLTTKSSSQIRSHSTHAELLSLIKKKKKKVRNKKFTELLQVTEHSTKQTKTTIQKLKAHQLSEFINKTHVATASPSSSLKSAFEYNKYELDTVQSGEISDDSPMLLIGKNFDESRIKSGSKTLKDIILSYQRFKQLSLNDEYAAAEPIDVDLNVTASPLALEDPRFLEDDIEHGMEDELAESLEIDSIVPNVQKRTSNAATTPYKSKYHRSAEIEQKSRQISFLTNLQAYIDLCVNCGMVNRAMAALQLCRFKSNGTVIRIPDVSLYNNLINGYAGNGNIAKVREILAIMREDKINFTPQTYAGVFECIGRLADSEENLKLIKKYYVEAQEQGFTLNDIMDKSKFAYDQREIVTETLQTIDPHFMPIYTPPVLTYNNTLLNDLNRDVLPVSSNSNLKAADDNRRRLRNTSQVKRGFTRSELKKLSQQQLQMELKGAVTVKSIAKFPEPNDTVIHYRKKLTVLQDMWKSQICNAFNRDINTLQNHINSKSGRAINLIPYLRALDVSQYAEILLKEIRHLTEGSETYSPTVNQLYRELGQKAQTRYQIETKKRNGIMEKTNEIYDMYCEKLVVSHESNDNTRQIWERLIYENRKLGPSLDIYEKAWPRSVMMGVGRFLYNILMRDIKIDINIVRLNSKNQNLMPAFYTLFRNHGRLVKEEIKPHPVLSRLYRGSQQQTLVFETNMVPMLCPPQPWNTPVNGGYLIIKSDLIRLPHQAIQQWNKINEAPTQNIFPALDSLNQLASIPWKINSALLDVVLEVFNNGGDKKLDVPQHPKSLPRIEANAAETSLTKQDKFNLYRQKLLHRRKQGEMYSLWCDALYRLSLANHYRDKVFWLPHNMDFRGRVYPLPPHLNHLGSDMARSLLVFHEERPLGPNGFNWLKLHCINLTGLKKRDSIIDRLLYAEDVMEEIIDSAENPLTGRMWWTKSDEPWQTLGCCMEIAKVLKCDKPEEFLSSFPIHQDGSCNGLQHYAALGRDTAGAISVNLSPSDVPQDVYSAVAALVEGARQRDASNGLEIAKKLSGFVQRKVIKQTVMTTVYGVTRFGARLQIARQLKDIDSFPKDWVWPASCYLTTKTFESLREMFTSTKEIQDWFTDCARFIASVGGVNVEWVTPLGLPVVQPYNRSVKKSISKTPHHVNEHISMDQYEIPNVMKQKNAFPPNFIHSLDSSHMMLTSLHCEKAGMTFVSVHDCFWTHACNVEDMNKICREQFVALHSQPILEDLSHFLENKYSFKNEDFTNDGSVNDLAKRKLNITLAQLPKKGDFDLNNILKSVYFFS